VKVVVTGATSLLGASVVSLLAGRGDEVTVFQRNPSAVGARDGVHEVLGTVSDLAAVSRAVTGHDAVVHLAAKVSPVGQWQDFYDTNVVGTKNVVASMHTAGVARWVYVSTPSVAHHGTSLVGAGAGPADADRAKGHYAKSKALAETLALAAPGLATVAIRPHLVWGPGDTQLVGRIVDRAKAGRLLTVGTGAALIDTTYLDNAAEAIVAALDRAEAHDVRGKALVVSNGEPRTVTEILQRICDAAGVDGPRSSVPLVVARSGGALVERVWEWTKRDGDPPMTAFAAEQLATAHWFDQRQTRELLRWEPRVTLDEGFRRLRESFDHGKNSGHGGTTS
jgi:nucleoside-diphosphate-sugar epimerase